MAERFGTQVVRTDGSSPLKKPDTVLGPLTARLWQYQRERFPLANHGIMTVAFAASACTFAAALVAPARWPSAVAILLAALAGLSLFALLRIADEHKDYDTDAAYRPYRPVPRGLVTLAELRALGLGAAALLVVVLALAQSLSLAILAAATCSYFALMSAEFFASAWLKRRPIAYLASHMLIMPLIAWLLAGVQLVRDGTPLTALPREAGAFFASMFFVGLALELGRKVRAERDEEAGVETYSALWGARRACAVWLGCAIAAAIAAALAVAQIGGSLIVALPVTAAGATFVVSSVLGFDPTQSNAGKRIEQASGALALAVLVALGLAPHVEALP